MNTFQKIGVAVLLFVGVSFGVFVLVAAYKLAML